MDVDSKSEATSPPPPPPQQSSPSSSPPSPAQPTPPSSSRARDAGGVQKRYRPTPAKTFQCRGYGECRMVFSRSEHLARHIRKHTGERPFTCHCGKLFSRLDNLRQHAQTVHADLPEQNDRMMRDLSALHASMAATSKAAISRGQDIAPARPPDAKLPVPPKQRRQQSIVPDSAQRPDTSAGYEGHAYYHPNSYQPYPDQRGAYPEQQQYEPWRQQAHGPAPVQGPPPVQSFTPGQGDVPTKIDAPPAAPSRSPSHSSSPRGDPSPHQADQQRSAVVQRRARDDVQRDTVTEDAVRGRSVDVKRTTLPSLAAVMPTSPSPAAGAGPYSAGPGYPGVAATYPSGAYARGAVGYPQPPHSAGPYPSAGFPSSAQFPGAPAQQYPSFPSGPQSAGAYPAPQYPGPQQSAGMYPPAVATAPFTPYPGAAGAYHPSGQFSPGAATAHFPAGQQQQYPSQYPPSALQYPPPSTPQSAQGPYPSGYSTPAPYPTGAGPYPNVQYPLGVQSSPINPASPRAPSSVAQSASPGHYQQQRSPVPGLDAAARSSSAHHGSPPARAPSSGAAHSRSRSPSVRKARSASNSPSAASVAASDVQPYYPPAVGVSGGPFQGVGGQSFPAGGSFPGSAAAAGSFPPNPTGPGNFRGANESSGISFPDSDRKFPAGAEQRSFQQGAGGTGSIQSFPGPAAAAPFGHFSGQQQQQQQQQLFQSYSRDTGGGGGPFQPFQPFGQYPGFEYAGGYGASAGFVGGAPGAEVTGYGAGRYNEHHQYYQQQQQQQHPNGNGPHAVAGRGYGGPGELDFRRPSTSRPETAPSSFAPRGWGYTQSATDSERRPSISGISPMRGRSGSQRRLHDDRLPDNRPTSPRDQTTPRQQPSSSRQRGRPRTLPRSDSPTLLASAVGRPPETISNPRAISPVVDHLERRPSTSTDPSSFPDSPIILPRPGSPRSLIRPGSSHRPGTATRPETATTRSGSSHRPTSSHRPDSSHRTGTATRPASSSFSFRFSVRPGSSTDVDMADGTRQLLATAVDDGESGVVGRDANGRRFSLLSNVGDMERVTTAAPAVGGLGNAAARDRPSTSGRGAATAAIAAVPVSSTTSIDDEDVVMGDDRADIRADDGTPPSLGGGSPASDRKLSISERRQSLGGQQQLFPRRSPFGYHGTPARARRDSSSAATGFRDSPPSFGAYSDSPFSFHPPALTESYGTGGNSFERSYGLSSASGSSPFTFNSSNPFATSSPATATANPRKRSFAGPDGPHDGDAAAATFLASARRGSVRDGEHAAGWREYRDPPRLDRDYDYENESRPQSRRLSIMELCNEDDGDSFLGRPPTRPGTSGAPGRSFAAPAGLVSRPRTAGASGSTSDTRTTVDRRRESSGLDARSSSGLPRIQGAPARAELGPAGKRSPGPDLRPTTTSGLVKGASALALSDEPPEQHFRDRQQPRDEQQFGHESSAQSHNVVSNELSGIFADERHVPAERIQPSDAELRIPSQFYSPSLSDATSGSNRELHRVVSSAAGGSTLGEITAECELGRDELNPDDGGSDARFHRSGGYGTTPISPASATLESPRPIPSVHELDAPSAATGSTPAAAASGSLSDRVPPSGFGRRGAPTTTARSPSPRVSRGSGSPVARSAASLSPRSFSSIGEQRLGNERRPGNECDRVRPADAMTVTSA